MRRIVGHLTLSQRLMAIVAVAIVPTIAALIYYIGAVHATREREVEDFALRTSQFAALEMERITSGAESVLRTLSFAPTLVSGNPAACTDYLRAITATLPQFGGFAMTAPDGTVICDSGLGIGAEEVRALIASDAARTADGLFVGTYTAGPHGNPFLPMALPGEKAILITGIDLNWLNARLRERDLARGSALAIVGRDGVIIARQPTPEDYVGRPMSEPFQRLLTLPVGGAMTAPAADGTRRIIGYQPPAATGTGLYIGVALPLEAAFAPMAASTLWSVGLALAGVVFACGLAWLVGDRLFRRPIRRILATIDSWRAGDETARTGLVADGSELAALGAAIDEYMDGIASGKAAWADSEAHRQLLLREMNHRIKNLMANVQAIANQTFRDGAAPDSLRAFGQRLSAMAAAHDLLVSGNWQSADLEATLRATLEPFGLGRDADISLAGPPLRINARAALALAMSLHELGTNAAKYGALSCPGGSVNVRWATGEEGSATRFRLAWIERGGPPVTQPERSGFGTRLMRAAFSSELDARTELRFLPAGFQFTLDAAAPLMLA